MFAIVGLFIIATFAVGAISILVPLRRLGITTRLRGLAVAFVSVLAFILFGAFISATRSPEEKARLEAKQPSERKSNKRQNLQRFPNLASQRRPTAPLVSPPSLSFMHAISSLRTWWPIRRGIGRSIQPRSTEVRNPPSHFGYFSTFILRIRFLFASPCMYNPARLNLQF
jgi:hypothetical protein